ncbi:SMI1/KNR4 family protein [Teichococcus wenyumeiae]|nr:SMI1/KNR4 family protein [Pseudoroseomonas wenyumeiae]
MADPQFASLILLLVLSLEEVGPDAVSSGVETCWQNIREHAPPALLPFVDNTGGNHWAFDGRARHRDPAIVFVDPELASDDAIFPVAPSFDAFLAMIEAGA